MLFEISKRRDILDAAFKLLVEEGSQDATIHDILRNAGVTLATFYKYFESKQAVADELHVQLRMELDGRLSAVLLDQGTARERIHELWTRMASYQSDHRHIFAFLEIAECRGYFDRPGRESDVIPRSIYELIEELRGKRAIKDLPPEVLGSILWGTFVQLTKVYEQLQTEIPATAFKAAEECAWEAIRL